MPVQSLSSPRTPATIRPWEQRESVVAFHNRWLHVTLDTVCLPNGQTYEYTTIRRDSVGVAAVVLNQHGQVLLEQEYRHPVGAVAYQLPGGLNVVGEDPAACIRRELREETGVTAGELRYLGRFWNNPATSNGECLVYLCRDFTLTRDTERDAAEFLAWDWYDLPWVKASIAEGIIRDRVVICGLAYLWLNGEVD
jgi:ADP-ribose pyrophosphatase